MEISMDYIESTLNSLNIGYYLGEKIDVQLDKEMKYPTSFIDMIGWNIMISPKNIIMMAKNAEEKGIDISLNEHVRNELYHEVSHAIDTPIALMQRAADMSYRFKLSNLPDIINCGEDERIETKRKYYYMHVNFKDAIMRTTGWDPSHPTDPTNPYEMFYQVVRYRYGPKDLVTEVQDICDEYKSITAADSGYSDKVNTYIEAWADLYKKVEERFEKDEPKGEGESSKTDGSESSDGESSKSDGSKSSDGSSGDKSSEGEKDKSKGDKSKSSDGKSKSSDGKSKDDGLKTSTVSSESGSEASADDITSIKEVLEALKRDREKIESGTVDVSELKDSTKETVLDMSEYVDKEYADKLKIIFEEFKSNLKGQLAATSAYSGIFNPRAVATRKDYRYWIKQSKEGDIHRFSKLHLILCVDSSGSMFPNENEIRKLLWSLNECEKRCDKFTFDYIDYGAGFHVHEKNDLSYFANGGNDIPWDVHDRIKRLYKKDSVNKVIMLADGDILSDYGSYFRDNRFHIPSSKSQTVIAGFNYDDHIMISEESNDSYFHKYAPKCKYVSCDDYVTEFKEEIIKQIKLNCRI